MLDEILKTVKSVVQDAISQNADVPSDKKDLAVKVSTDAIAGGLTDNIEDLAGLFSGDASGNAIVSNIQKTVADALTKKVGLDSNVSGSLVSTLLPLVISALSGKLGSSGDGFNLESIIGALGGGTDDKKGSGGIFGALGKLFG